KTCWVNGKIETQISGPRIQTSKGAGELSVPIIIVRSDPKKIKIQIQDQTLNLMEGEWSPWIRLEFKAGMFNKMYGIARFHLSSVEPELGLYLTPINLDPQSPAFQISYPSDYAKEIFDQLGNFYTQGIPYDTWALNEGRLSDKDFLEQSYSILDENLKTLDLELGRFNNGLLFSYFGITDLIQHMFWNPGLNKDASVQNAISDVYKRMDKLVGDVMTKMPADTTLVILSDHGFCPFKRAIHINSWLRDNGFLSLNGSYREGQEFFANVDWQHTTAYSLG